MALERGGNLSYMTMTTNEQDKQFPASPREVELKNQISPLQSQVTELNKAQDATIENPELLTEVQVLKNTLGEHSMLIEQSTEKLSQLVAENLALRE